MTVSLDLGCGSQPKNPFSADSVFGIDVFEDLARGIRKVDLFVDNLPFDDESIDFVTAFDFLEHVPRVLYCPTLRFSFVALMSEVHRVLVKGGRFLSFTPGYPSEAAFVDPTHVNFITLNTFPTYFGPSPVASIYGFTGSFIVERNEFHDWTSPPMKVAQGLSPPIDTHIITIMKKM